MTVGKNISWKKWEAIYPIILRLKGRISSGEKGKRTDILGEENQD